MPRDRGTVGGNFGIFSDVGGASTEDCTIKTYCTTRERGKRGWGRSEEEEEMGLIYGVEKNKTIRFRLASFLKIPPPISRKSGSI